MARYGYQYETSPRKLEPEYEPKKNPYKKKKSSIKKKQINTKQQKSKTKRKLKKNVKVVLYVAIGFAMLFTISYRNSVINESFNKKEELKKELSVIQKENEQMKVSIENSLNLNTLEQAAKERLGMQKLNNNQKVYISLPKKDYVEPASEQVVIQENQNWWDKLVNSLMQKIN